MASGKPQITNPNDIALSESPSPQLTKVPATASKAGSSKKMTDKEQSERFIETARMLQADEDGKVFQAALDQLLPLKAGSHHE